MLEQNIVQQSYECIFSVLCILQKRNYNHSIQHKKIYIFHVYLVTSNVGTAIYSHFKVQLNFVSKLYIHDLYI